MSIRDVDGFGIQYLYEKHKEMKKEIEELKNLLINCSDVIEFLYDDVGYTDFAVEYVLRCLREKIGEGESK